MKQFKGVVLLSISLSLFTICQCEKENNDEKNVANEENNEKIPAHYRDRYLKPWLARQYFYPWEQLAKALAILNDEGRTEEVTTSTDPKEFQIVMNVNRYKPEEIQVKIKDGFVIVRGQHSETGVKGRFLGQFDQRFALPDACRADEVTARLNNKGILKISAPIHPLPAPEPERTIKITLEENITKEEELVDLVKNHKEEETLAETEVNEAAKVVKEAERKVQEVEKEEEKIEEEKKKLAEEEKKIAEKLEEERKSDTKQMVVTERVNKELENTQQSSISKNNGEPEKLPIESPGLNDEVQVKPLINENHGTIKKKELKIDMPSELKVERKDETGTKSENNVLDYNSYVVVEEE